MELGQPLSPTPTRSVQAVSKSYAFLLKKFYLISYLPSQHLVAMHSSKSDTTMAHVNMQWQQCDAKYSFIIKAYTLFLDAKHQRLF